MTAQENKRVLEQAFACTARGDGRAFIDMIADEARWTIIGSTVWSRDYRGKKTIVAELLRPLAAHFEGANVVTAANMIAEGDRVAVEGRNHSVLKGGLPYGNRYCWIFTFRDGKAVEIVEYCDTDLVRRVLSAGPGVDRSAQAEA